MHFGISIPGSVQPGTPLLGLTTKYLQVLFLMALERTAGLGNKNPRQSR